MTVRTVEILDSRVSKDDVLDGLQLADTAYGPSQRVWQDFPRLAIMENPAKGFYLFDDFRDWDNIVTPTITTQATIGNGYKAFGSSGGTILPAAVPGGSGLAFVETDDNEGLSIKQIAMPFKIIRGGGHFCFEAAVKASVIADTEHGFFLGLNDAVTLTAIDPIVAAGTLADHNFVGFHRLEADGDQIDTVYKANGIAQVTVKADALPTAAVADTYIKLGMRYWPPTRRLYFYVNNVLLPDSKLIPASAGDDFPNDVYMGLCFAMLCASSNDSTDTLAWWAAGQVYSPGEP